MARLAIGLVVAAAVIAVLLAWAAYYQLDRGPDPQVEAFERERVVTFAPPGGTLYFGYESKEDPPAGIRAKVVRLYAYDDAESARNGRLAVVDVAEADGWRVTGGRGPSDEVVWAAKTLPTGDATLMVDDHYYDGRSVGGAWPAGFKLQVLVEGGRCSAYRCKAPLPASPGS